MSETGTLGMFEEWVRSRVGPVTGFTPLAGDASRRSFFRVVTQYESFIAMESGRIPMDSWVDINNLLHSRKFPVPELYFTDIPAGWAIMEDLGDTRLLDLPPAGYMKSLGDALELLERMQRELTQSECAESIAGRRHFTASFFAAELDHTLEHLFFRLLRVPPDEVKALQEHFRNLCALVSEGPRVFAHRDFHSANLMIRSGSVVMVDWQDARFGPPEYDLVSMLRDSYVDIGSTWETLARKFLHSTGRSNLFRVAACACQRSLKAAGTFAYQYRAFERAGYLDSLPRTMRYLDDYSRLCPRLKPLVDDVYRILDTHTGEIDLTSFREADAPGFPGRPAHGA